MSPYTDLLAYRGRHRMSSSKGGQMIGAGDSLIITVLVILAIIALVIFIVRR